MEEDNDDQWLYGEDSSADKLPGSEEATERSSEADALATKGHDGFMNSSEAAEDDAADLEPPIIKPLDANTFDNDALPPGEEDLLVPPIIAAPDSTIDHDDDLSDEKQATVNGEADKNEDGTRSARKLSEGEDEEDEDDNINVVVGDIRTAAPNYNANLHIKRGNLLTLTKQSGKFATDDFESVGVINGVPAHEFNLDNLEDKPWRKPGADITDYFNYGFNEDTWRAYCERQKRMRVHESGSGLIPMNQTSNNVNIIPNVNVPPPNMMIPPVGIPPPDVNSNNVSVVGNSSNRRNADNFAKENTIQVMTADRREYSKKNFTPDLSVPPPAVVPPPYSTLPPGMPPPFPPMNQYGPPPSDYFTPEMDPYYQSYEPAQEPSWGGSNWNSNVDVKNMIPITNGNDRSMGNNTDIKPSISDSGPPGVKIKTEPDDREVSRERDRDRSRDYDRDRDTRHRERSHRHRSRSRSHERRSRKHKSRSRSPGYRSHKKKKSKKSERSKSDSD